MTYIYLASPYSHPNPEIRRGRYRAAEVAVHWMLLHRLWVYSPIVHNHLLTEDHGLPMGGDFWTPYSQAMLEPALAVWVLQIQGYVESKGIHDELEFALSRNIPVGYIKPDRTDVMNYVHSSIPYELRP